jgi:hypothetical protein
MVDLDITSFKENSQKSQMKKQSKTGTRFNWFRKNGTAGKFGNTIKESSREYHSLKNISFMFAEFYLNNWIVPELVLWGAPSSAIVNK